MGQSYARFVEGRGLSKRPVVGVLCCNRVLDGRQSQAVANRFLGPLADISNAAVLLVPAIIGAVDVATFATLLDGLLLTGSCSHLGASRYRGGAQEPAADEGRDEVALRLAGAMIEAGRPVFGICRGLQELNVLFGGSLRPDAGESGHHSGASDDRLSELFDHYHGIAITPGGWLAQHGGNPRRVNSVHHQGIDRLGGGLTVEAVAPDGLVEAVSASPNGAPVLGVQWHPEWDASSNQESRGFFELLGTAARGELIPA